MAIAGCRAQVEKLMDISNDDVGVIEDSLQPLLDSGVPRKKAQVQAVQEAINLLLEERALVERAVADQLLPQLVAERSNQEDADALGAFEFQEPVRVPDGVRYSQREYNDVVEKYRGTDQWMKAPNGRPTQLTEKQWVQVRTPSFKAWFGPWDEYGVGTKNGTVWNDADGRVSKVVDENGEPKVVYHGTDAGGFMTFNQPGGQKRGDIGIFTTDNWDMARSYVRKNRVQDIAPPDLEKLLAEAGVELREYQGRLSSKEANDRTLYGYTTPEGEEVDGFDSKEQAMADAAEEFVDESDLDRQPGVYALFVNLRNPTESDFEGAIWNGSRDHQWIVEVGGYQQFDSEGRGYFDSKEEAAEFAESFRPGDDEGEFDPMDYVSAAPNHYETSDDVAREGIRSGDGAIIHNVVDDGGGPGGYDMTPSTVYVLKDPEQLKSADFNVGTFSAKEADLRYSTRDKAKPKAKVVQDPAVGDKTDISRLSAGRAIPESVAVGGLESSFEMARGKTYSRGRELKQDIQAAVLAAAKKEGVSLTKRTKALHKFLSDMVYGDAMYALKTNENAIGWYDHKVSRAIGAISVIHPEINTDKQARLAFLWALAVTSNGLKVDKNFELAEAAYRGWKQSSDDVAMRVMPTNIGIGNAAKGINDGLGLFNQLVSALGHERAAKFMATEFPAGDITRMLGIEVGGEWTSTPVRGAAILGPKIGNGFYMNLNGYFDALTMDRWLMRTFGRMTGTLLNIDKAAIDKSRAKLKAAIAAMSPAQRKAMAEVVGAPVRKDLTTAELDALSAAVDKSSMKTDKRELMQASEATNRFRLDARGLYKSIDGQKEAPSGPAERNWIRAIFATALERLRAAGKGMTMSDLQALLWYPERRLYDAAKADDSIEEGYEDDDAPDYANAAMKLALANGAAREDVLKAMDAAEALGTVRAETLSDDERSAMLREMRAAPDQLIQMMFEVAPDPADTQAVADWSQLSAKERAAITLDVRDAVLQGITDITGIELKKVVGATGGFKGQVNPNLIGEYQKTKVSYEQARQLAAAIGYVLDQDSVAVADPRSSKEVDLIRLTFNKKPDAYVDQVFAAIRAAVPQLDSFTLRGNNLDILNFTDLSNGYIVDQVKSAIDNLNVPLEYVGSHGKIKSELVGRSDYEGHLEGIRSGDREGVRAGLDGLRDRAREIVASGIDARRAERAGAAGLDLGATQSAVKLSARERDAGRATQVAGSGRAERADGSQSAGQESGRGVGQADSGNGGSRGAQGAQVDRAAASAGAETGRVSPLPGAPTSDPARVGTTAGPDPRLVKVAEQYALDHGIELRRQAEYVEVDPERAKRIAEAYAAMPHAPQDPLVQEAYANLIRQTTAQYQALEEAGYKFWLFADDSDPYGTDPWAAMADLRENKTMAVYATAAGFGSDATFDTDGNPLLADTGIRWPYGSPTGELRPVLANDLFRAVHDAFGHGLEGAGFRARGEENAWQAHVRLFTGSAVAAITSETRGQNSWLNFGPNGQANQGASVLDTVFADQKTGLMPEWTWTEGRAGDMRLSAREAVQQDWMKDIGDLGPAVLELPRPKFYSQLQRAIESVPARLDNMAATGWKQWLTANASKLGIKAEEMEWSGIKDYLDMQGKAKLSKQELSRFLDESGVRVEETVLMQEESGMAVDDWLERWAENNPGETAEAILDGEPWDTTREIAERQGDTDVLDRLNQKLQPSKYDQYTLPGGTNYRELLLTLPAFPNQDKLDKNERWLADGIQRNDVTIQRLAQAEVDKLRAEKARYVETYQSSHWDQKNVIAHIRVNDRTDAEGSKVLFVEEIQSDWGQDGKKRGFKGKPSEEAIAKGRKKAKEIGYSDADLDSMTPVQIAHFTAAGSSAVPVAPFVSKTEGWLNLALKRIAMMAVEGGYDKVAFVNGEQSADRYNLAKHVGSLSYEPGSGPDSEGLLEAFDLKRQLVMGEMVTPDRVEDYIGKEVAQRLLATDKVMGRHLLDGESLKVGGEGMKTFYDQIVPQAVSKLLPKLEGEKLVTVEMSYDQNPELDKWEPEDGEGDGSKVPVVEYRQPGFDVTDKMRKLVASGVPMFSMRDLRTETPQFKDWSRNAPLVMAKDALSYDFQTGKPFVAQTYHGTNADEYNEETGKYEPVDFVSFDAGKGGRQTGASSARMGTFSTSEPLVAGEYAANLGMSRVLGAHAKQAEMIRAKVLPEVESVPEVKAASAALEKAKNDYVTAWNDTLRLTRDFAEKKGFPEADNDSEVMLLARALGGMAPEIERSLDAIDNAQLRIQTAEDNRAGRIIDEMAKWLPQRIMPLYVRMANPKVYDAEGKTPGEFPLSERIASAKEGGHDGVVFKNIADPSPVAVHYVSFNSEDIKSAIGNRGSFDAKSPDIRLSSREFKTWFGDSKVVDSNGKPLVVYHGTLSDVSTFTDEKGRSRSPLKRLLNLSPNKGQFFFASTPTFAGSYAGQDGVISGGNIMPVYLSIKNPLEIKADAPGAWGDIFARAKQGGYDGIVIRGYSEPWAKDPSPADVFIALDNRQIKSAIGNNGQFSPSNPDIRFSKREAPEFYEDIPSESWLQSKIDYAQSAPRSQYGVPKMSSVTGYFKGNVVVPVRWAKEVPGQRGEQSNVRQDDLEAIRQILRDTGKMPLNDDGREYVPYIEIGYDGKPWVSEGNHRIMAAAAEGMDYIPVEVRYFDGGQRRAGKWSPSSILGVTKTRLSARERTTGDFGRQYSQDQKDFFRNVGRTTDMPTLRERLVEFRKDIGKKMAQGLADQFVPLKELGGNAYTLARLSKGASGAFEALLHHGKLNLRDGAYDADMSGGFVETVGKALGTELEDFMWWIAANRADRLSQEDREHLFTAADIAAGKGLASGQMARGYVLANGQTTRDRALAYADALKKFDAFNKNVLDMAEQSGLIDAEARQIWGNEFYVPFYRVSDEDGAPVGNKVKGGIVRQRAFKSLKGGAQKLNSDLTANVMQNWAHLIDASAKNRAAKATLESAQALGIAIEAPEEVVRQIGKSMGNKNGVVWFLENGRQRHFLVDDPYILEAINSLEYAGLRGPLMDALSKTKHWLTIGVTASPAFKVRNLIRDSLQAIATAELSYNPIKNLADGIRHTRRDNQEYVSALAAGGLVRFGSSEATQAERVRQLVSRGVPPGTILDTKGKLQAMFSKYVRPGLDAYQELGDRGEEINRMALYKQLVSKGMDHAQASLMARDLMDFSMQGTFKTVRFLTQVVPFLNARIQGLYKLGKSAQEDPKRFGVVVGAVALASIALMAAYGDDDDWKKREDWDRDGFWWFKFGGVAFRIPKPFEVGAIASVAERGVELFTNDEFTTKRFLDRIKHIASDNLSMNPVPQAVKPILDIYANKDSFSGRPIETLSMERLNAEYRYTSATSLLARGLSYGMNAVTRNTIGTDALSPVQIDALIRGYTGWLGTTIVASADWIARQGMNEPQRPSPDWYKVASQGFLSELPNGQSKYVSAMYEQLDKIEEAYNTHRQLIKDGKIEDARQFAGDNKDLLSRYRLMESVKKSVSANNKQIRAIEIGGLDPDEKKRRIQALKEKNSAIARKVY